MPRTARASAANVIYHVLNRGNARATVFHHAPDNAAFCRLIGEACERLPLRVLAACLMPNHFHLVLWPHGGGDLSRWMQWLTTAHVRRYHACHKGSGHVWQGRFKAFPTQGDEHLYHVLRYVERNALRANLAGRAEDWPWGSLAWRGAAAAGPVPLSAWPVGLPADWADLVNRPQSAAELAALRHSVARGTPYGAPAWRLATADALGLESTLRPRGRPPKREEGEEK